MKKRIYILIVVLLSSSILIFLTRNSKIISSLSGILQTIFVAPKSFLYGVKVGIGNKDSEEIEKLKEENANSIKKLAEFERVKRDNEALRSQFETGETRTFRLLPAHVIGFLGKFSDPTILIIDKGSKDGLAKDMAVIVKTNLVGKIGKVSPSYSQVILTVSEEFSTLGKTGEALVPGVVEGEGDFILFDKVLVTENIPTGDLLLTKGEINERGYGIPPDLIIGKIASVNKNERLPFQTAKAENIINNSKLETVFVVLGI